MTKFALSFSPDDEIQCHCNNFGSIADNGYTCGDGTEGNCEEDEYCYLKSFMKSDLDDACRAREFA